MFPLLRRWRGASNLLLNHAAEGLQRLLTARSRQSIPEVLQRHIGAEALLRRNQIWMGG